MDESMLKNLLITNPHSLSGSKFLCALKSPHSLMCQCPIENDEMQEKYFDKDLYFFHSWLP